MSDAPKTLIHPTIFEQEATDHLRILLVGGSASSRADAAKWLAAYDARVDQRGRS